VIAEVVEGVSEGEVAVVGDGIWDQGFNWLAEFFNFSISSSVFFGTVFGWVLIHRSSIDL
jgi:uncharacterized membrane protein